MTYHHIPINLSCEHIVGVEPGLDDTLVLTFRGEENIYHLSIEPRVVNDLIAALSCHLVDGNTTALKKKADAAERLAEALRLMVSTFDFIPLPSPDIPSGRALSLAYSTIREALAAWNEAKGDA